MKNNISSLFTCFDIFGAPVGLNFQGQRHYKSLCGGLITIFTTTVLLAILANVAEELVARKNPQVISYVVSEAPEEKRNLFDNYLRIFVALKGFPNNEVDPRAGKLQMLR